MAGETEAEAVQTFLDPLQQSISCVSSTVLNVRGGYFASDKPHVLTIGSGAPVRLNSELGVAFTPLIDIVRHMSYNRRKHAAEQRRSNVLGEE